MTFDQFTIKVQWLQISSSNIIINYSHLLVYIASFFKPIAHRPSFHSPFAPRQVHQAHPGHFFTADAALRICQRLRQDDGEHRVRTRALRVHICRRNCPRLVTLRHQIVDVLQNRSHELNSLDFLSNPDKKSWIDSGSIQLTVKGNFWTRVTWNSRISLWKCWEIRVIGLGNSTDRMYGLMMVTGWRCCVSDS